MSAETAICETCGGPLDWRGRCDVCARFGKLRGQIEEGGGFRAKRKRIKRKGDSATGEKPKPWTGESGVDNALPRGDRE